MNKVTLTSQESQAHFASVDATGRQSEEDGKPCVTGVTIILFEVHFAKLHFSLNRSCCKGPENINIKWRSLSLEGYREKWTRERHARGDWQTRGRGRGRELAKITHKFSFPPRKFQNTAERENRRRKRAADQKVTTAFQVKTAGRGHVEFIYLFKNRFRNSFPLHTSNIFYHWTSNFNVSARIRTQYFNSRLVYIWKSSTFRRLSSPS